MARNKKYNLDEAPTRNADGSYSINYNGDNYTIQPSALNSGNITVTTPEVVVKGKKPYSSYSFGTYVPFEYSRNSYYRPEDALEAFNTITGGGLNWIDPTQWARRAIDLVPLATGDMSMSEYGDRWINGNEGLVTANFAKNHPIASMLFNGVVGGLPYAKALNYTTRAKDFIGDYVRGHLYSNITPFDYRNFKGRLRNFAKGLASFKQADIENPNWINELKNEFGEIPYGKYYDNPNIPLEARIDAWRIHNGFPQKYGYFVPSKTTPGAYNPRMNHLIGETKFSDRVRRFISTDEDTDIKYYGDIVNSTGGNTSPWEVIPFRNMSDTRPTKSGIIKYFDWWDSHPFSRDNTRLSHLTGLRSLSGKGSIKIHKAGRKLFDTLGTDRKIARELQQDIANGVITSEDAELMDFDDIVSNRFGKRILNATDRVAATWNKTTNKLLDRLDNWAAKQELGTYSGGKPFLVETEIPFYQTYGNVNGRLGLKTIAGFEPGYFYNPAERNWWSNNKHLFSPLPNKKSSGGSIHIAPSKRGTFTAAATKHGMSVQEFANRVLRNKNDYSPSLVKKANFARNASKWH